MNSPISRIGGKKLLRKAICEMFPDASLYDRYVEVFGGAAWVLFYKDKHAAMEVYNDADGELVNFMRCVKYHVGELQRELQGYGNSREIFYNLKAQADCPGFTDIQRAARFFLLARISYGADGRTFGCAPKPLQTSTDYLTAVSKRLYDCGVVIEHKDFADLIKVYDRPNTLFYLDPPYHTTEKYYNVPFAEADHIRLKQCLNSIKGLFLLSYNDDDFIRELYKDYNLCSIERSNNLSRGKYKELIITNY